jgi:hypothetical protein
MGKPRVFIGSANESKHVASALHAVLVEKDVEPTFWADVFTVGRYNGDDLRRAAESHDFAIFVFSPDDAIESRGENQMAPRDNVIYELGLFTGVLGPGRSFVVADGDSPVKIPTDLSGVTYTTYNPPEDLEAGNDRWRSALRPAVEDVAEAIANTVSEDEMANSSASTTAGATAQMFGSPLDLEAVVDARRGLLPAVESVKRGHAVVHPLHGVGLIEGSDPERGADQIVWVRFGGELAAVPRTELYSYEPSR